MMLHVWMLSLVVALQPMYCDGRTDGDPCEMDCSVGTYPWVCSFIKKLIWLWRNTHSSSKRNFSEALFTKIKLGRTLVWLLPVKLGNSAKEQSMAAGGLHQRLSIRFKSRLPTQGRQEMSWSQGLRRNRMGSLHIWCLWQGGRAALIQNNTTNLLNREVVAANRLSK